MSNGDNKAKYEYYKVSNKEGGAEQNPPKYGFGVRHIQVLILLLCLTVNIIGRAHLAVTIVAMTSDKENVNTSLHIKLINNTDCNKEVLDTNVTENNLITVPSVNGTIVEDSVGNPTEIGHKTYNWPKSTQEMVLNAFFLGYMIMMFPMGMVCQRFGGKLPLQIGLFINAFASIITPWLTLWGGWMAVCGCRILQGLSQAGTYPCTQALLAKWVPTNERATFAGYVYSGLNIGTIVGFQLAGFLGASRWGWPSTFYTIGVINIVCFILLTVFGAASPKEHKTITEEERVYIMGINHGGSTKRLKTPWRSIFTSKPLWGTIATHVGSSIAFIFFFNQVPTYIHYILGINVRNSGMLSSLPYVASIFTIIGFGWLSDYCTNKNIVSLKNARRISNTVGQSGIAFLLILMSYTSNTIVAVSCLVVAMAAYMGTNSGWMVNHIDLAPNFSGTLTATGNTLANIFLVLSPVVVSYVVTDMTNIIQWRIMFFIISAVALACNTVFVVLVSTDIQPWNYADQNEVTDMDVMKPTEENLKEENLKESC